MWPLINIVLFQTFTCSNMYLANDSCRPVCICIDGYSPFFCLTFLRCACIDHDPDKGVNILLSHAFWHFPLPVFACIHASYSYTWTCLLTPPQSLKEGRPTRFLWTHAACIMCIGQGFPNLDCKICPTVVSEHALSAVSGDLAITASTFQLDSFPH